MGRGAAWGDGHWAWPALGLALALGVVALWAMGTGAARIPLTEVARILVEPLAASRPDDPAGSLGESREALIVWSVRLPRVLAAVIAGAALAVAGAIMQAATQNPLAEPGLLGVNAGAAFAVVLDLTLAGPAAGSGALVWVAFAGAALAALAVYGLGGTGREGPSPVRLVLAGVVVGTFLAVLTSTLLIFDDQTMDAVRIWTAGSLKGRGLAEVRAVLPHVGLALVAAMVLRDRFTALSLGAEVARGLGQDPMLWRGVSAVLVVMLAGGAVAVAGPVGFVGLVVPHMVRLTVGGDYRRLLPLALLGGALLTLLADTLPRALWGNDLPVGISLALVGAPFFIWLARSRLQVPA